MSWISNWLPLAVIKFIFQSIWEAKSCLCYCSYCLLIECSTRKMSSEGIVVSSTSSIGSSSNSSSTGPSGVGGGGSGILLDSEDRSSTSPSLPSLSGLPLRIRSASLPALIELCISCFGNLFHWLKVIKLKTAIELIPNWIQMTMAAY